MMVKNGSVITTTTEETTRMTKIINIKEIVNVRTVLTLIVTGKNIKSH